MTATEAREKLKGPLRFGDPYQIEALRIERLVKELRELATTYPPELSGEALCVCVQCFGTGRDADCNGYREKCGVCDGDGCIGLPRLERLLGKYILGDLIYSLEMMKARK